MCRGFFAGFLVAIQLLAASVRSACRLHTSCLSSVLQLVGARVLAFVRALLNFTMKTRRFLNAMSSKS